VCVCVRVRARARARVSLPSILFLLWPASYSVS